MFFDIIVFTFTVMLTTLSFPCLSMKPSVSPHDYSLSDINLWTTENDFKLNSNKSELHTHIVGSKSALVEMTTFTLSIDGCTHHNLRREGRVSALVSVPFLSPVIYQISPGLPFSDRKTSPDCALLEHNTPH